MEIYVKADKSIDAFAEDLRKLMNCAGTNPTDHQRGQRRDSLNRGGIYYLFEFLGLELLLLQNSGETSVPEREDFQLYLFISTSTNDETVFQKALAGHLKTLLEGIGYECAIADLAS